MFDDVSGPTVTGLGEGQTMGLYEKLTVGDGIDVAFPDVDSEPSGSAGRPNRLSIRRGTIHTRSRWMVGCSKRTQNTNPYLRRNARDTTRRSVGSKTSSTTPGAVCEISTTDGPTSTITACSSSTPPSTVITSASRRSSRTGCSWRSCGLVRCMDSPSHRVLSGFHHCLSKRRMDVDGLSYVIEGRSSLDCKP